MIRAAGVLLCLALGAYATTIWLRDDTLWASVPWMVVWFAGALLLHDAVLFPLYAAADRLLVRLPHGLVNHVRLPVLGAGLTFLLFLPGIIRQGEPAAIGATGLDQSPYLVRWLWLVAGMVAVSAVTWVARLTRRSAAGG